jgi:hypothetical protein
LHGQRLHRAHDFRNCPRVFRVSRCVTLAWRREMSWCRCF